VNCISHRLAYLQLREQLASNRAQIKQQQAAIEQLTSGLADAKRVHAETQASLQRDLAASERAAADAMAAKVAESRARIAALQGEVKVLTA
jgi:hypothetical protein